MSSTEHRTLLAGAIATALLLAAGLLLGWSGEAIGTAFMLIVVATTAVGASLAPRERPHR